jgi:hypothetical protein
VTSEHFPAIRGALGIVKLVMLGLAMIILLSAPAFSSAQERSETANVLSALQDGGLWVTIPILAGEGTISTVRVPAMALGITGCVNVWHGHSGSWQIEAHENVLGSVLRIEAQPGLGVPFEHDFGMQAQVDVKFSWSEARDTTLMLWVGVALAGAKNESLCQPKYGDHGVFGLNQSGLRSPSTMEYSLPDRVDHPALLGQEGET